MAEKLPTVHLRALQRAADILGGKELLREHLRVTMPRLEAWLAGEPAPMDIFLKAVDVISASVHADARALRRNHSAIRFLSDSFTDRRTMLAAALDAAIEATHADMGNVQLARADGLQIVAQRGFAQPFLEYFAVVREQASACGRALASARRVIVGDVARHETFAGTRAGDVMQAARAFACQSTPLVGASGNVLGVISTHFHEPHVPSEEECASVDDIAQRAAHLLETAPL